MTEAESKKADICNLKEVADAYNQELRAYHEAIVYRDTALGTDVYEFQEVADNAWENMTSLFKLGNDLQKMNENTVLFLCRRVGNRASVYDTYDKTYCENRSDLEQLFGAQTGKEHE